MQQPPGGPLNSAQSVALEPVGSCEDALTLRSQSSLQQHRTDELLCMSFICLCACYCVDLFQRTRADSACG